MTLTSGTLDTDKKPKRKRNGRKRKKSKPSPNSDSLSLKKIKHLEARVDTDIESEPDLFLDAQENPLEPPCTPQRNSDNGSDSEPEPETVVPHNISLPTSDSGGETFLKTVLEPNIMESPSPSQSQQSQSLLAGPGMGYVGHAGEPLPEQLQQESYSSGITHMSQLSHMQQLPQQLPQGMLQQAGGATGMYNPGLPVQQYQTVPSFQMGISDHDIMKIATKTRELLSAEIEKMVEEKVKVKTAELSKSVESLKSDNENLKASVTKLEAKLITKIDDLEQYSRRSCVRIAGIPERDNENTDDHVLDLAARLDIDIGPRDIDRSHRVGPISSDTNSIADDAQPRRPREIIVKLKGYQARLRLLQGRKTLRQNKENVYINEDLTKTRKSLAFECRKLRRERKILKTWVYDGNIFVTERGGSKLKVTQDSELDEYRNLVVPPASEDRLFPTRVGG